MFQIPTATQVAVLTMVLAVVIFLLTFAQKLGGWRSRTWAMFLVVVALMALALWVCLAAIWFLRVDLPKWVFWGVPAAIGTLCCILRLRHWLTATRSRSGTKALQPTTGTPANQSVQRLRMGNGVGSSEPGPFLGTQGIYIRNADTTHRNFCRSVSASGTFSQTGGESFSIGKLVWAERHVDEESGTASWGPNDSITLGRGDSAFLALCVGAPKGYFAVSGWPDECEQAYRMDYGEWTIMVSVQCAEGDQAWQRYRLSLEPDRPPEWAMLDGTERQEVGNSS